MPPFLGIRLEPYFSITSRSSNRFAREENGMRGLSGRAETEEIESAAHISSVRIFAPGDMMVRSTVLPRLWLDFAAI
jgi:hypothetical protein